MKNKVLFLTNIPSPYRVDFFNELGKYVDLTVVFEKRKSDERDESWTKKKFISFKAVFLNGIKASVNKAFCPSVASVLKKHKDHLIVCCNFATPTGIFAVNYMIRHSIPYIIECDGAIPGKCNFIKAYIKKRTFKNAAALLSTSKMSDEYYLNFGADADKIYRYHFSSMSNDDIIDYPCNKQDKASFRKLLGITEKNVILSVGRFVPIKGFDVLLKASKALDDSFGIYLVGGSPTEEYMSLVKSLGLKNIHFVGFKEKEELKKYFLAADSFVFPTRSDVWGLVINEAMGLGLPVISTNKCVAATEMIDEKCGYVVESDNPDELRKSIDAVFERDLTKMGQSAIDVAKKYTIETMCDDHLKIFKQLEI